MRRFIPQRFRLYGLIFILSLVLASCTLFQTLEQKWDKATDEERTRIVLSQSQKSLKNLWNAGQIFVTVKPEYKAEWKAKAVPAFDVANKILGELIAKGATGQKITYIDVTLAIGTKINDIAKMLESWGVKVSSIDGIYYVSDKEVA